MMFDFEDMRKLVNDLVEVGHFPLLEAAVEAVLTISPNTPEEMPWQLAFEHAIDIGSLAMVQEIDRRFYHDFGSGDKDMWTIFRSSHKNHLNLVEYFVEEKKKEGICRPYLFTEIARAGAANNNQAMVAFAFREICDLYEDPTDEKQKDAIFEILADRSSPIKSAATYGHVEMLKYLVSVLGWVLPEHLQPHVNLVASTLEPFYYAKNIAIAEHYDDVVKYIDSLVEKQPQLEAAKKTSVHRFFSKATGMEVGGKHLTDTAMADFYLQMRAR